VRLPTGLSRQHSGRQLDDLRDSDVLPACQCQRRANKYANSSEEKSGDDLTTTSPKLYFPTLHSDLLCSVRCCSIFSLLPTYSTVTSRKCEI